MSDEPKQPAEALTLGGPRQLTRPADALIRRGLERASELLRDNFDDDGAAPRGETALSRGHYVYCIIRSTEALRFGAIGIDDQSPEVYTITDRDMAAVVSDVPIAPLDSTRENVLAHERVNETVMRDHTVIPMSFGTIFKTREDTLELLRSAYDAFADVLAKIEDKLEFGLKVLWDRDRVIDEIERELAASPDRDALIEVALRKRARRYKAEFLNRLRDVSVASRVNKPVGKKMIMNAAFLVRRDEESAFDRAIREIAFQNPTLSFKYTGPWPPYNFVNIRLKLKRAHDDPPPGARSRSAADDVDADWESAYSVGDEAPDGDNPTPDQDVVDDIGRAVGVESEDNEELKSEENIAKRGRHRWKLDPASSDDYNDR
jgi:hypothetical protein